MNLVPKPKTPINPKPKTQVERLNRFVTNQKRSHKCCTSGTLAIRSCPHVYRDMMAPHRVTKRNFKKITTAEERVQKYEKDHSTTDMRHARAHYIKNQERLPDGTLTREAAAGWDDLSAEEKGLWREKAKEYGEGQVLKLQEKTDKITQEVEKNIHTNHDARMMFEYESFIAQQMKKSHISQAKGELESNVKTREKQYDAWCETGRIRGLAGLEGADDDSKLVELTKFSPPKTINLAVRLWSALMALSTRKPKDATAAATITVNKAPIKLFDPSDFAGCDAVIMLLEPAVAAGFSSHLAVLITRCSLNPKVAMGMKLNNFTIPTASDTPQGGGNMPLQCHPKYPFPEGWSNFNSSLKSVTTFCDRPFRYYGVRTFCTEPEGVAHFQCVRRVEICPQYSGVQKVSEVEKAAVSRPCWPVQKGELKIVREYQKPEGESLGQWADKEAKMSVNPADEGAIANLLQPEKGDMSANTSNNTTTSHTRTSTVSNMGFSAYLAGLGEEEEERELAAMRAFSTKANKACYSFGFGAFQRGGSSGGCGSSDGLAGAQGTKRMARPLKDWAVVVKQAYVDTRDQDVENGYWKSILSHAPSGSKSYRIVESVEAAEAYIKLYASATVFMVRRSASFMQKDERSTQLVEDPQTVTSQYDSWLADTASDLVGECVPDPKAHSLATCLLGAMKLSLPTLFPLAEDDLPGADWLNVGDVGMEAVAE